MEKQLRVTLQGITVCILLTITVTTSIDLKDVPEDGKLDITGLAMKYLGVVEEYDVTTEDGYILKLFRIPSNASRPLLYIHGLMASGDEVLMRGNDSIGLALHKAGYDLWVGNYRGNRYSRRHVKLNPDGNPAFWKFGPHEHGCYDLAAFIDFVLNKTAQTKLSLIGYSQGTLITYILGSERPEYNDKIKIFIALAPVCHLQHITVRLPKIVQIGYAIRSVVDRYKIEELGEYYGVMGTMLRKFCAHSMVGIEACRRLVFMVSGYDAEGLESEFIPTLFWHYPAGTSRRNLEHLLQMVVSKRFANFDYGPAKNMVKYKSKVSPEYHLKKVTMRVFLMAAKNDRLSVLEDTRRQAKELPNVDEYMVVEDELFNHIDFIWSRRSLEIQPKVLQVLDKYN